MFFMLAQAVDDPWDEQSPVEGSGVKDWVWATRDEVASKITNVDYARLVEKMLAS